MNGEHLAVARYELGDANLDSERSNNIDLALSYAADDWFANVSIYRNDVDNYIYLRERWMTIMTMKKRDSDDDHEEGRDDDHEEGHDEHGNEGLTMSSVQNDATFSTGDRIRSSIYTCWR